MWSNCNKAAFLMNELLSYHPPETLKDDRDKPITVESDMMDILLLMGKQTNKQFELESVDPNSFKCKINGKNVSLVPDETKIKSKICGFLWA